MSELVSLLEESLYDFLLRDIVTFSREQAI